ncbi:hypothetical protein [Flavivirga aquatica]|uniref:hypothetical protein n=1 Tax=Flavivirga aquatica TaxID=1849968 RepID=UPI000AC48D77|nr:hypothetical protein [Flavivirga aquatica]
MKKPTLIFTLLICFIYLISCDSEETPSSDSETINSENTSSTEWRCGTHNGKSLWTGPKGGCYYYNSNNNKTYVDRSECNC